MSDTSKNDLEKAETADESGAPLVIEETKTPAKTPQPNTSPEHKTAS